jgi:hypothetical protein
MNAILNRGFVHPYIVFQFAAGTIDTEPPRYFASFSQNRSVKQACSFTLTITYVPQGESEANNIHNMLLASVNKPVYYQYGYVTPNGGRVVQNNLYTGLFTTYDETLNEGSCTYTISGVARSIEITSPEVNVDTFIKDLKSKGGKIQPSEVARRLIMEDETSGIKELFENFDINIDQCDTEIEVESINIPGKTLHDVFFGTVVGQTVSPNGLVNLSHMDLSTEDLLSSGLLSESDYTLLSDYNIVNNYASSSATQHMHDVAESVEYLRKSPFVCYFDNVVGVNGTSLKGSFYYKPMKTLQPTNIFIYHYGNNFLDSDVLSFNAHVDCTVAMNNITSLQKASVSIDPNGNTQGSNLNLMSRESFNPMTFETLSGFDESAFVTASMLAEALHFPFEADMTIVGQTDCNELMDTIEVLVYVNGSKHILFSGKYIITDISDELSENGFTTTFKLLKSVPDTYDVSNAPNYVSTSDTGRVYYQQVATINDYK